MACAGRKASVGTGSGGLGRNTNPRGNETRTVHIECMRIKSNRGLKADEHVPTAAASASASWTPARSRGRGCPEGGALEHIGISRRTLYRR